MPPEHRRQFWQGMSGAFHQTRLDEMIGRWIARVAGSSVSSWLQNA